MTEPIRLSPYIAHTLVTESPRQAWASHRRLGGFTKPPTKEMDDGKIIHALVLGTADREIAVIRGFDDFRKKAAQEERDAAYAAGMVPIIEAKMERYEKAAERIAHRIGELGYDLAGSDRELRVEWKEAAEVGFVDCSGVIDMVSADRTLIADLKTRDGSVHPDVCAALIARSASAIQAAAYPSAIQTLNPKVAGRTSFVFLYAQTVEPYEVVPLEPAGSMRELGESRWLRAVETWGRCLAAGVEKEHWPGYCDGPVRIEAPAWALAKEIGMEGAA